MKRFSLAIVAALSVAMMAMPADAGQKGGGHGGWKGGGHTSKTYNNNWNRNSNKNFNFNKNSSRSTASVNIKMGNNFDVGSALNGAASIIGALNPAPGPSIRVTGGNTYVQVVFGGAPAAYPVGPMKGDPSVVTTRPPNPSCPSGKVWFNNPEDPEQSGCVYK